MSALLSPNSKTLIFCPIGLGNFIMVTSALRLLASHLSPSRLHLLALKPGIAEMAREMGIFGAVHCWDPDTEGRLRGLRLLLDLRSEAYDASISLFPSGDWKFAAYALGISARRRMGFAYPHQFWPSRVQHLSVPLKLGLHDVDQNLQLAEKLTGKNLTESPPIECPLAALHPADEELRATSYFVCHPGSSLQRGMKDKRFPAARFGQFIGRLHRRFGLKCVLIGGPEESAIRAEVAESCPPAALWNLSSRSLSETAGIIRHARFYLGNDSGLMHFAVALDRPCIALFGPTDERRTGPYGYWEQENGRPRHLILRQNLQCAPCRPLASIGTHPPCVHGDVRCLAQMEVDAHWPAVENWVSGLGGSTK